MILYENGSTKGNAEGTTFTINDTSNGRTLKFYKYEGQTTQEGTPTPSSPQSINVVTGNNTITIANSDNTQTQTYSLNLGSTELCKIGNYVDEINKSSGKNLFDKDNANVINGYINTSAKIISNANNKIIYIPCQPNTTYSIQKMLSATQSSNRFRLGTSETTPVANMTLNQYVDNPDGTTMTQYTITTNSVANYLVFFCYSNDSATTFEKMLSSIQIEKGTQATSYEPYGTSWYIKKNIGKVVLNGSEIGWSYSSSATTPTPRTVMVNGSLLPQILNINYYSNYFIQGSTTSNRLVLQVDNVKFYISLDNDLVGIVSGDTNAQKVEKMKTWLSTHNTDLYYVLANPTYTIITDTDLIDELDALENATTYDNQTNITQTNANLPLYTYVEYIQPLDFSRNGLGVIPNVLNAKVVDEINGEYSLTFEYPMSEPMATELVEDRIVKCKVADGTSQCFIIKKIQKNFDKMSVYCTHLFYLLYDNFLEDTYPQNLSPKPFFPPPCSPYSSTCSIR